MSLVIALALAGQAAAAAPACATPEHRQFDFWVGRWTVTKNGNDKVVAHSVIEKLYNGCAIRENWMPLSGQNGGSLSAWDPDLRKWRQTWVDSSNSWLDLQGGINGGAMQLSGIWRHAGGPGIHQHYRVTWSSLPGGKVRQLGETTPDGGKTWQTSFDFIYAPDRQAPG